METKRQIRHYILEARSKLSKEECENNSRHIIQKVLESEKFKNAHAILVYIDYNKEVETRELIKQAWKFGKRVYAPKTDETAISFHLLQEFEELRAGLKGILEPAENSEEWETSLLSETLMIMPGVVFDKQKHRIGYGRGYYDRFLAKTPGLSTIAICFECQLLDTIPYEEFDYIPDILYTEAQTIE